MLETEVVEEVVGDSRFTGGSGARRNGRVVGRFALFSLDVGEVISEQTDDEDDELIDVFSNFSLSSLIRWLFDHLTPLMGLRGVC